MLGSEIKELVVIKMEEYSPFGSASGEVLLAGGDVIDEVKPLYSYIDGNIDEAANEILRLLPIHILSGIAKSGGSTTINEIDRHTGKIDKPANYLRLYSLQMDGWSRPVHSVVRPQDPLYVLQFNRWTRGTPQKPIVTDDGLYLRYYSVDRSPSIIEFLYIERFDENTDYPLEVAEAIALNTAYKVYAIFGNDEQVAAIEKDIQTIVQVNSL